MWWDRWLTRLEIDQSWACGWIDTNQIDTSWISRQVEWILSSDEKVKTMCKYMSERKRLINLVKELYKLAEQKLWNERFIKWYEEHITILQWIYKKLFPNYNEILAWHCIIWATPPSYKNIKQIDFPWEYSLENFIRKFKEELEIM